jgi:hypothetical protein
MLQDQRQMPSRASQGRLRPTNQLGISAISNFFAEIVLLFPLKAMVEISLFMLRCRLSPEGAASGAAATSWEAWWPGQLANACPATLPPVGVRGLSEPQITRITRISRIISSFYSASSVRRGGSV